MKFTVFLGASDDLSDEVSYVLAASDDLSDEVNCVFSGE